VAVPSVSWVGSLPAAVSTVNGATPAKIESAVGAIGAVLYVVVPAPPWRCPTPKKYCSMSLLTLWARMKAVPGRSSSPRLFAG
jgi:hypothetical protein